MNYRDRLQQCREIIRCDMLAFLRSRVGVFWTFVFPMLALFAYTQVMGAPSLAGAVIHVEYEVAGATAMRPAIEAVERLRNDGVRLEVRNPSSQTLATIVVRPHGSQADILITSTSSSDARYPILLGALRRSVDALSSPEAMRKGVKIIEETRPLHPRQGRAEYIVPGLAVMIAMSSALMGFAVPLAAMKEFGLTKQHALWPVPSAYLLAAWGVGKLIIILVSTAALVGIAVILYGFGSQSTLTGVFQALLFLLLGVAALLCLGLAMAARIGSTQTATVVANMIYFFGIFTGNILLPVSSMASGLQRILLYSPINSIADGIRLSLYPPIGSAITFQDLALKFTIIVGFGLICFAFAAKSYDLGSR